MARKLIEVTIVSHASSEVDPYLACIRKQKKSKQNH